ncbi:MAG: LysM peptidoglycan-binding domain-containing protein [Gammaproteobacteria bacterium]|nr:LysM peptidoglycan-binding domain-containing protein [Gammaproteobacteria bacterium]
MSKVSDVVYPGLKLLGLSAVMLTVVGASGCISAKRQPAEAVVETTEAAAETETEIVTPAVPAAPATAAEPVTPAVPEVAEPEPVIRPPDVLTSWIVARGENLWDISGVDEVYNQADLWPLLYKSNIDQITDADLIYPGQVLRIPRDVSGRDIDAAVQHARNRGAWALGPVELSDKEYLRQ